MINGKCKKCGKDLQIDEELTVFSCMYCGARLSRQELLITDTKSDPTAADRHFRYASDYVVGCVTKHRGILQHFNRMEYVPSFAKYVASCGKVFDELNCAVLLDNSRRDIFIDSLVNKLISGIEADWETNPSWGKKSEQKKIIDSDKMIIAIYLIPMVGKLGYSISDDFNNRLQKTWVSRYPKYNFQIGSYDKIIEAYDAKLKLCYITTAVCRSSGKADNCYELETLRSFRDNWLAFSDGGAELIREYYDIAPAIVTCMELTGGDYQQINNRYIQPCISDIEAGNMIACRDRYVLMVHDLKNQYLS